MKELKKQYRENYEQLKNIKAEVFYVQRGIDELKQSLVSSFEEWYVNTFDEEDTETQQVR